MTPYVIYRMCLVKAQRAQEPSFATLRVKLEHDNIPTLSLMVAALYGYETWFLKSGNLTYFDCLTEGLELRLS